jgi:phage terminase small subunit
MNHKTRLTELQRKAINYYLQGYDQRNSMLKAGYSPSTCDRPYDCFGIPRVRKEIERRQQLAAKRADLDLDWCVDILKQVAESDITDLYKIYSDGSFELDLTRLEAYPHLKKLISSLEVETYVEGRGPKAREVKRVKIRPQDRIRAIELIIRHLGLSKEKINVEGEIALVDRINQGLRRVGKDESE